MNKVFSLLFLSVILFGSVDSHAQSALNLRIRGAITAFDGREMLVKSRDGEDLRIIINEATKIKSIVALKADDIKQGGFVGVTARRIIPGGHLVAREVHIFEETQRGVGEGHYAWDLEPGSTMTNANVDAIANTGDGKELTLGYKEGSQKIIVPRGTPVISFLPADKSILKKGAQIFCIARQASDGSLTAQHISAGKNGLKPPM